MICGIPGLGVMQLCMNNLKMFASGKFVTPSEVSLDFGKLAFKIDRLIVSRPNYS